MQANKKYSINTSNGILWCNYTGYTRTVDVVEALTEIYALSTRSNWEYVIHNFDDVIDISLGVASIVAISALGLAKTENEKSITTAVVTNSENFLMTLKTTGDLSNRIRIFANSTAVNKSIEAERPRLNQ